ncbi:hypothetical protein ElyMa_007052500 [Elysia marginata]|uniref:Uncharacterized protein n=1 Tax=Elysia marginata TaxID=1093978 RepID=A0AAV4JUD0_9GAST|nr:hypothetical protein ElyMa_007052500 [Elysia marginata]
MKKGKYGKTAQFWYEYLEKVWNLILLFVATRTNNFDLHIASLQKLCPLLFSMNNQNYAKYLSLYTITLLNLPENAKGLLRNRGFSVSRSDTPAGRSPVDMIIEQTINKHAKTSGGIIGFSRSLPAYHRWCVTRHNRSQYVSSLQQVTNLDSSTIDGHKDMTFAERKLSEKSVRNTMEAFSAFINPFEMDTDELICLSSGCRLSDEIAGDLLKAEEFGQKRYEEFVKERLKNKTVEFKDPLPKSTLKTFACASKVVSVKSKTKEIQIKVQRNLFGKLLILSQDHDVNIEKVLSYPLSPTPRSFATPDGLPLKTNKAVRYSCMPLIKENF